MAVVGIIIGLAIRIYTLVLIARAVISWIPALHPDFRPRGWVAAAFEIIYTLTDPPIKFFQRFLPPLRVGGVALDMAFLVVFFVLMILARVNSMVFF